jgi:hypothetical protein
MILGDSVIGADRDKVRFTVIELIINVIVIVMYGDAFVNVGLFRVHVDNLDIHSDWLIPI